MTDRPILFSAPMVRALNEGRKTQTRRILNPQPFPWAEAVEIGPYDGYGAPGLVVQRTLDNRKQMGAGAIRFAPGDRLYVREEWASTPAYDDQKPSEMGGDNPIRYKADDATVNWAEADGSRVGRRRAGMHMPRWASRLTLTVTDVRVEPLNNCSEADAIAEGIHQWRHYPIEGEPYQAFKAFGREHAHRDPRLAYRDLWNSINGAGAWEANPWVVAVTFTVEQRNIDHG